MKMLRRFDHFYLPALFFLLLSLVLIVLIHQAGSRNHALELVASNVVLADAESDHEKAINRYQLRDQNNPLILFFPPINNTYSINTVYRYINLISYVKTYYTTFKRTLY